MQDSPLIEDIRKIRQEMSARFNHNVHDYIVFFDGQQKLDLRAKHADKKAFQAALASVADDEPAEYDKFK